MTECWMIYRKFSGCEDKEYYESFNECEERFKQLQSSANAEKFDFWNNTLSSIQPATDEKYRIIFLHGSCRAFSF